MTNRYEPGTGVKVAGRIYAGLVAFGFAIICFICAANSGGDDEVTCGGQEMEADDTCVTFGNGDSYEQDYDEVADAEDSPFDRVAGVIGGIIAIAFGLFALFGPDPDSSPSGAVARRPSARKPAEGVTDAELVSLAAAWQKQSGAPLLPMTFKGRDIEVVVSGADVSAWSTARPTGGLAERRLRFRLEWSEIAALEYDRDGTGAVRALVAVGRRDGSREPLADAVQLPAMRIHAMAAAIESYSDGRVRLR